MTEEVEQEHWNTWKNSKGKKAQKNYCSNRPPFPFEWK
jgi:hypothetical protein